VDASDDCRALQELLYGPADGLADERDLPDAALAAQ
jgi:hypothetical protein